MQSGTGLLGVVLLFTSCSGGATLNESQEPPQRAEIGEDCSDALGPVRRTMAAHDGAPLTSALREQLRIDLEAPYEVCSQEEYNAFTYAELSPWGERLVRSGS